VEANASVLMLSALPLALVMEIAPAFTWVAEVLLQPAMLRPSNAILSAQKRQPVSNRPDRRETCRKGMEFNGDL
jgi:hypothetical protein